MFRVYFDEDALGLRLNRAVSAVTDAVSAASTGRRGLKDADQLEFGAREGRVLVTYNQRHFAQLHAAWMRSGRSHSGIICVTDRRASPEVIAAKVARLLESRSADQMRNIMLFLNGDPQQSLSF